MPKQMPMKSVTTASIISNAENLGKVYCQHKRTLNKLLTSLCVAAVRKSVSGSLRLCVFVVSRTSRSIRTSYVPKLSFVTQFLYVKLNGVYTVDTTVL